MRFWRGRGGCGVPNINIIYLLLTCRPFFFLNTFKKIQTTTNSSYNDGPKATTTKSAIKEGVLLHKSFCHKTGVLEANNLHDGQITVAIDLDWV